MLCLAAEERGVSSWEPIAEALSAGGVASLVVSAHPSAPPAGRSLPLGVPDALSALSWLSRRGDVDPQEVFLAADGAAALVALAEASREPGRIAGLILVSPLLDSAQLDDKAALDSFGSHPLFIAVSRGDKKAAKSALVLDAESLAGEEARKLFVSQESSAGPAVLSGAGGEELLVWLKRVAGAAAP